MYSGCSSPTTTAVGTQGSELFATLLRLPREQAIAVGNGRDAPGQSGRAAWDQLAWWAAQVAVHTAATHGKLPFRG